MILSQIIAESQMMSSAHFVILTLSPHLVNVSIISPELPSVQYGEFDSCVGAGSCD